MSAKWTFMVYVAGYNNLSSFAGKDLAEMRKVGSSDGLKIAVFVKRLEQQAAHRIIVGKDGSQRGAREPRRGRRLRLAPDAARLHPLGEGEGAGGALRADRSGTTARAGTRSTSTSSTRTSRPPA